MREPVSEHDAVLDRTLRVLLVIRLGLIVVALAALPLRETLPEWMTARYAYAAFPLLLGNALALLFHGRVARFLDAWRIALAVDLLASLALLMLGGGWRSSYFGYTLTTIVLFTAADGKRGAAVSAMALALASLLKDPAVGVLSAQAFLSESWDLRVGACEFYLLGGLTIGYFRTLQDRVGALSAAKLEETRKLARAEEKARMGLELHDGAKQAIIALLLRMNPLMKKYQSDRDDTARELRWLWVGMNYLKSEFDQLMDALKEGDRQVGTAHNLALLIEEEVKIAETMTGASWKVSVEIGDVPVVLESKQAFRRFVGEALMNTWRHSGTDRGTIAARRSNGSVVVTVADDGRGFDLADALASGKAGLTSLGSRAEELKGALLVETAPGSGCRVTLTLPPSVRE